eukprot:698227-Rhodomonas_salina.2
MRRKSTARLGESEQCDSKKVNSAIRRKSTGDQRKVNRRSEESQQEIRGKSTGTRMRTCHGP